VINHACVTFFVSVRFFHHPQKQSAEQQNAYLLRLHNERAGAQQVETVSLFLERHFCLAMNMESITPSHTQRALYTSLNP